MSKPPPIELLRATHVFPGRYHLKVIGLSEERFVDRAVAAVRETLQLDADPAHTLRETPEGKHVAVSFELQVSSAEQVHEVYLRLLAVQGVVILL